MITTYFKDLVAGNVFGVGSKPAFPKPYYIGLSSSAPSEDGSNVTEPSSEGTGYARVAITQLGAPVNGVVKNESEVTFPKALQSWFGSSTPATHYVIFDQQTGGNLLICDAMETPRVIEADTYLSFPIGELSITVS